MTPTTPAMTAQEALANERNARVQACYDELMREGKHGHYETLFRVVREEVSDAERRATEAGERIASLSRNLMDHERELRAVEARCGLMREALQPFADKAAKFDGTWIDIDDREQPYGDSGYAYAVYFSVGQLRRARTILAYPGGKSDQGEKEKA